VNGVIAATASVALSALKGGACGLCVLAQTDPQRPSAADYCRGLKSRRRCPRLGARGSHGGIYHACLRTSAALCEATRSSNTEDELSASGPIGPNSPTDQLFLIGVFPQSEANPIQATTGQYKKFLGNKHPRVAARASASAGIPLLGDSLGLRSLSLFHSCCSSRLCRIRASPPYCTFRAIQESGIASPHFSHASNMTFTLLRRDHSGRASRVEPASRPAPN
jgi:hypothetical protein